MKRIVSFSLDTDLVKQIETKSWESHMSRSMYLENLILKQFSVSEKVLKGVKEKTAAEVVHRQKVSPAKPASKFKSYTKDVQLGKK